MALAYYFSPPTAMTAQQYGEIVARLRKAGAGHPAGRSYHAAFGSGDNLKVFDVWTSQAAFEKFGQTLMPIMQQMGLDPGQPAVANVHNVIVPAAKKSRPAAKKGGPAKRAPAKKRKARSAAKRR
jgi:hypothetical protein